MKNIFATGFLSLCAIAAHAAPVDDVCNNEAEFARTVARARDNGYPESAVIAKLPNNGVHDFLVRMVGVVYAPQFALLTPEQNAANARAACYRANAQ